MAARMCGRTGEMFCVTRLTNTMVTDDARIPADIGARVVGSARESIFHETAVAAPVTIEAMAPGVLAFRHQTAHTKAGAKALPRTDVVKITTNATAGGSASATT